MYTKVIEHSIFSPFEFKDTRVHFFELRYYGTPPCCDVLFIEINHKIKGTFIVSFLKFSSNIVAQWVGWFPKNLKVMSLNPPGVLNFLPV